MAVIACGLGKPGELESDSDVPFERECRVPDFSLEPDVDGIADGGDVNEDAAMHQLPGLRVTERDAETEHGNVDDFAIACHIEGDSPAMWQKPAQAVGWRSTRLR